jgi:hypothetical protein
MTQAFGIFLYELVWHWSLTQLLNPFRFCDFGLGFVIENRLFAVKDTGSRQEIFT